ncbi:MAG: hypothetical protein RIQ93_1909, partial [Verrucomicrobiota bacterium]
MTSNQQTQVPSPVALVTRPQLTPDELHQLKWLLGGMLTLLAISTVLYLDVDAWILMAVATAATLVTLVWPTLPSKLPRSVDTLAFPVIVAIFVGDLWLHSELLPAMVRLDMLLLLYRNVTYRQRRDDLQIIVLGLFLVVVAGVLTVSLAFAAQILLYTACSLAFLFVITLAHGTDGEEIKKDKLLQTNPPSWAVHARWGELLHRLRLVADWRVVALGMMLFVGVMGVSALLFMAIPRFQLENSMFLDRFISKKSKTGFSDTIRFGDVTDIQQDTGIALSVDVTDQSQIPASPYWRMLVLDDYREGAFRLSIRLRNQAFGAERTGQQLRGEARPRLGESVFWTFYFESGISRYLPLLGQFEELRFREAQNFRWASTLNAIAMREEPVTMTAYRVEGFLASDFLPDPAYAALQRDSKPSMPVLSLAPLRVPEAGRARLRQLLLEFLAEGEAPLGGANPAVSPPVEATMGVGSSQMDLSAAEFAQKMCVWLRDRHGYSLAPRIPAGEDDPLVRWAVSREAGHCELFAGAFVLLARIAGFPARLVTGFKGGSWNGYSNNFTIRNSDAHAWAEIFDVRGGGWLRADPLENTAGSGAQNQLGAATLATRMDRSWAARLESLRVFWYRRIVSFDQRSQAETLKAVKEATESSGRRLREALSGAAIQVRAWLTAPWDGRRLVRVGAMAIASAALVWIAREFGLVCIRGIFRRGARRYADPVRREAAHWLRKFSTGGGSVFDAEDVREDLQRLRFGAPATWP